MHKGFFGAFTVLLMAGFVLSLGGLFAGEAAQKGSFSKDSVSVLHASFERSQAEMLFDSIIERELSSPSFPSEANLIKARVNSSLLAQFYSLGLEMKACTRFGNSFAELSVLDAAQFDAITKVMLVKVNGITIAQYHVTGGPFANVFPCTKIVSGNFSSFVAIPAGYESTSFGVSP